MAEIMFAGTGGQGVLTAGKLLTQIAAEKGKNVCWTSEYSAEMRGGYALSRVVISDEDIGTPYPDMLDVLCCMDENSCVKYAHQLRPGGVLLVNRSLFTVDAAPEGVRLCEIDATNLAAGEGNPRGANLVMLGAMIHATAMLDEKDFGQTLLRYFEQKGKGGEENLRCFTRGCERVAQR